MLILREEYSDLLPTNMIFTLTQFIEPPYANTKKEECAKSPGISTLSLSLPQ
jgi:hypothetical protein